MKLNGMTIRLYCTEIEIYTLTRVPVAQWLEQCVSSAKVVGSIPREHMY